MSIEGYGVCRTVEDAKEIAEGAYLQGLKGCYPAAAVVLVRALETAEKRIVEITEHYESRNLKTKVILNTAFGKFYDKDLAK